MNDYRTEKTEIPEWMCQQEEYTPSKDKEAFLTKSTKSVLSVLGKLRFHEGKDGRFSATPSLKLFYTLIYIILTASARNYLFVLIMCAAVTVRLAFFFSSIYSPDIKRNRGGSSNFNIAFTTSSVHGKSPDVGQYYSEGIRIGNAGRYFVIRDIVE